MKKSIYFIISIMLVFSLTSCGDNATNSSENDYSESNIQSTGTELTIQELPENQSKVDFFIEKYNEIAPISITDTAEFIVQDKDSEHYRTEFRLGAYSEAYAKTGKINDYTIDIVCYGYYSEYLRIYAVTDLEQAKEIIKYSSYILDNNLTDSDIQKVLDDLDTNGEANGYYYGDLGLVYNKYRNELMLKLK